MSEKAYYTLAYPGTPGKHLAHNRSPTAAASKLANAVRREARGGARPSVLVVEVTDNFSKKKRWPYLVLFSERKPTAAERQLPRFANVKAITTTKVLSLSRSADGFAAVKAALRGAPAAVRTRAQHYMGSGPGK